MTASNRFRLPAVTDDHHELSAPGHPGVKQIAPEHRLVLCRQWDHDGRVLRPLRLAIVVA